MLGAAEVARVWRLGRLPATHADVPAAGRQLTPWQVATVMRAGYKVSSARDNAVFNLLAALTTGFLAARGITARLRTHGTVGPFRDLKRGGRHIHHFVPGALIAFAAGGVGLARDPDRVDRWLVIPFGVGIGLVLDEAALLLEFEDVYWTEEGVLSVQIGFATIGLLAAVAYAVQVRGRGAPGTEADWLLAARAWSELDAMGGTRRHGPGGTPGPPGTKAD